MTKADTKTRKSVPKAAILCRLFGLLLLIAVVLAVLPVTVPKLFGYEIYAVESGSMEPDIMTGSVVYVHEEEPSMIPEGEVIAFLSGDTVIIHRVVENDRAAQTLKTMGDANDVEDRGVVTYSDVQGVVKYHIPLLGEIQLLLTGMVGKVVLFGFLIIAVLLLILGSKL